MAPPSPLMRPLTPDDFKGVKVPDPPFGYLTAIADFDTRIWDAIQKEEKKMKEKAQRLAREKKLKKAITINGDNCAPVEEVRRTRNSIKKINFLHSGSKRKQISDDPRTAAGEMEMPKRFQAAIMSLGGNDWWLVLEKNLCNSDVDTRQSRFSVPPKKTRPGSLRQEELSRAETAEGMAVCFIQPSGEVLEGGLVFKRWKLNGGTSNYVLNRGWPKVARSNGLRESDRVQLWSFRVGSDLGFALVNCGQEEQVNEEEGKISSDDELTAKKSKTFYQFL